jgi:tRNA-dihydrouridine synthase
MVSLHPRTRAQAYGGTSDWSCIADLASRLPVPVTGSGDLYLPEDGERMFRETGCAAIMFARGALGNPFIFPETRALLLGLDYRPPGAAERMGLALAQLERLAADLGEGRACVEMRKHFCAYTKPRIGRGGGLPGGAALRNRLVHGETIEDFRRILEEAEMLS